MLGLNALPLPLNFSVALHSIYGFHGCSREDAENILLSFELRESANDFEWLGKGFYFWEDDPQRALDWAYARRKENPTVLGAIINPAQCLDLASSDGARLLRRAYEKLKAFYDYTGKEFPENRQGRRNDQDELKRYLDCAVVNTLFEQKKIPAVKSPFIEGSPVYPGGNFFEKTHTQICVREASCILGLFIVQDIAAWKKVLMFSEKSELPR